MKTQIVSDQSQQTVFKKPNLFAASYLFCMATIVALPVGSFEIIKVTSFLIMLLSLLVANKFVNFSKRSIFVTLLIMTIMTISAVNLQLRMVADGGSDVLLRSMVTSIVLFIIGFSAWRSGIIAEDRFLRVFILSLLFFIFAKAYLTLNVFINPGAAAFENVTDMQDAGTLGIPGLSRFVFINDYFLPFAYIFVSNAGFSKFSTRLLKTAFFIFSILTLSRYVWLVLSLVVVLDAGVKNTVLFFCLLFSSAILVNEFTEIKIIDAVVMRFGEEGKGSTSEKKVQAEHLINEISNYPYFGKGLGSYVENYVRNDRLKYGYEVFALVLLLHFGLFFSTIIIAVMSYVTYAFSSTLALKSRMIFLLLLLLFILSSLFNPVLISNGSACLILVLCMNGRLESVKLHKNIHKPREIYLN